MDSETSCPNFDGFTIRVCSLVSRHSHFSAVLFDGQTNANDTRYPPDAKNLASCMQSATVMTKAAGGWNQTADQSFDSCGYTPHNNTIDDLA